ncbi:NAD(P)-dependent oxidoreductase [Leucobacter sp. GX24907]
MIITVFGGSGYAGSHIVEAAAVRGHDVTSITRTEPAEQMAGVRYRIGDLLDEAERARALESSEVVVVATSLHGNDAEQLRDAILSLAAESDTAGVRLGVVGGASSLRYTADGPLVMDTEGFPPDIRPVAGVMAGVLDSLRETPESLDWFLVSPAGGFGRQAPGEYLGHYRTGGDVMLVDDEGRSELSGADFGMAFLDEIEDPQHARQRFTIAY